MTFAEWVNTKFGGSSKDAAAHLGLLHRTVYSYYALERFPRPTQCQIILLKSENRLIWKSGNKRFRIKKQKVSS